MLIRMLAAVRAAADRPDPAAYPQDVARAEPPSPPAATPELSMPEPPTRRPPQPAPAELLPQRVRGSSGREPGRPAGRIATSAREAEAVTEQFAAVPDAAAPEREDPAERKTPAEQAPSRPPQPPAAPARPARRPPDARPPSHPPRSERPRGGRRSRVAAAAAAVLAIVVLGSVIHALLARSQVSVALSGSAGRREAGVRNLAAGWLAGQVSRGTSMTCDPVMCAALRAHGIPAADLDELRAGGRDPVPRPVPAGASQLAVIVATATVRGQLGSRLSSVYAPAVIASFGSGPDRVEVRTMAGPGAAAFRATARADLAQRQESGAGLLQSGRIVVSTPAARAELSRGQVDPRLLVTIALLASRQPLEVMAFGDRAPGAGLDDSPLRSVELAPAPAGSRTSGSAFARSTLAFMDTPAWPFATASAGPARLPNGQLGVRFAFAAPSPLGLLG